MIPPLDPFSLSFDSIEIDPTRAPSSAAIEHALAMCAPQDEPLLTATAAAPDFQTPGFHLLDDGGGRFEVDREMGVITLKDEVLLAREHGAVHGVVLRVIEPSGASYDLGMQLRLTGRVPQMVGAEEFAALAGLEITPLPAPTRVLAWSRFAAAEGAGPVAPLGETAAFGAALRFDLPPVAASHTILGLEAAPPAPASRDADWSL